MFQFVLCSCDYSYGSFLTFFMKRGKIIVSHLWGHMMSGSPSLLVTIWYYICIHASAIVLTWMSINYTKIGSFECAQNKIKYTTQMVVKYGGIHVANLNSTKIAILASGQQFSRYVYRPTDCSMVRFNHSCMHDLDVCYVGSPCCIVIISLVGMPMLFSGTSQWFGHNCCS